LDTFYKMKPEAVGMQFEGLEELRAQHDELGCKDMNWYMNNVDVEMAWELDKVCHPYVGADDPVKCKGSLVGGRWTVTESMPADEYLRARSEADKRLAEEAELETGSRSYEL